MPRQQRKKGNEINIINETISENEEKENQEKMEIMKKIKLKQDLLTLVIEDISTPSALHTFFNSAVKTEILESIKTTEIVYGFLAQAVKESVEKPPRKNINLSYKTPISFVDFLMCEDEQIQEMLHLSRNTIKAIISNLRVVASDKDTSGSEDEPFEKMFYLIVWYLRSKEAKLEDAVNMFDLENVENAKFLFTKGVTLLLKLKVDSGLTFPAAEEQKATANFIEERYGVSGVAGVLGYKLLTAQNRHRLLLQGLCNENLLLSDLHISYDTRPFIAYQISPLIKVNLADGLGLACREPSFAERLRFNLIYPREGLHNQLYNSLHKGVSRLIDQTFHNLFTRFEKLSCLETCERDIVTAACIIYNYAVKFQDATELD